MDEHREGRDGGELASGGVDDPRHYRPRQPGRLFTIGWIIAVCAIVVVTAALTLARELQIRRDTERREQELAQGRRVIVIHPNELPPTRAVEVPATIRAWSETPIYAKIAGYVRAIHVDKGDRVTAGQVLVELESPEIDQQVANARVNYELQTATDRRNQELVRQGIVARQAADEAHAAMLQAKATLDQVSAMQSYETIHAPYDGIVGVRNVDPGALVPQATTSGSSPSQPILILGTISPVRVLAEVPESAAPDIRVGDPATITVRELPGRDFTGTVARRADALNPATRMMVVEVDVPNEDEVLISGMYARAAFTVALHGGAPQVPADALVFRGGKVYVPVVRESRLRLAEVTLGFDDGRAVEVTSGIAPDDLVALNVGQAIRDGETVQPVPADQK